MTRGGPEVVVLDVSSGLPIEVEKALRAPTRALDLARAHGLTVYDARYLETAIRRALPLATLDDDLRKAAWPRACRW